MHGEIKLTYLLNYSVTISWILVQLKAYKTSEVLKAFIKTVKTNKWKVTVMSSSQLTHYVHFDSLAKDCYTALHAQNQFIARKDVETKKSIIIVNDHPNVLQRNPWFLVFCGSDIA